MIKAVCFPNTEDQFKTPAKLMRWLDTELRTTHDGFYRYRQAPGLGLLEPGSIVFFYELSLIVGSAVVEKASRPLTQREIETCNKVHGTENCNNMVNIVKFFTNSIWVFSQHELVDSKEFKVISNRELTHYVTLEPKQVMELYAAVAKKRVEMYGRSYIENEDD